MTALALAGCAFPQSPIPTADGTIYHGGASTMQYRSPLPRDVHPAPGAVEETHGESCSSMLAFPPSPPAVFLGSGYVVQKLPWTPLTITAGDSGYIHAVARAREAAGGANLFDVRADLHTTSVFGIFTRECIEVHARVARQH
jgi:hypothetical protein